MKLITGEFEEQLRLQFAPSIKAGFPSPAEDYMNDSLDFNRDLIKHPEATFYVVATFILIAHLLEKLFQRLLIAVFGKLINAHRIY